MRLYFISLAKPDSKHSSYKSENQIIDKTICVYTSIIGSMHGLISNNIITDNSLIKELYINYYEIDDTIKIIDSELPNACINGEVYIIPPLFIHPTILTPLCHNIEIQIESSNFSVINLRHRFYAYNDKFDIDYCVYNNKYEKTEKPSWITLSEYTIFNLR